MRKLIVPGIGNSGAEHWQTLWQQSHACVSRIEVADWNEPQCADWVAAIERAMRASGPDTLIVAHSLGCLAVAHWTASAGRAACRAAVLVAVPDPHGPAFPAAAHGFAPLPEQRFDFPSLIVASDNDPYASIEHARHYANVWGSRLHYAGALGHINAASGLGTWDKGWELLEELSRST